MLSWMLLFWGLTWWQSDGGWAKVNPTAAYLEAGCGQSTSTCAGHSHHVAAGVQAQESRKEPGSNDTASFLLWSEAAQMGGQGTQAPPLSGTSVQVHCKKNTGTGIYCFEMYNMPQERGGTP